MGSERPRATKQTRVVKVVKSMVGIKGVSGQEKTAEWEREWRPNTEILVD